MSQAYLKLLDFLKLLLAKLGSIFVWRPKVGATFWVSLLGLVAFTALIWYFDWFGDVSDKVTLNLLYAIIPVLLLFGSPPEEREARTFRWIIYSLVSMSIAGFLLEYAAEHEWQSLGINVTMLLVSLPFFLICWVIAGKKPLLWVAVVPLVILAVIYLTFGMFQPHDRLTYALVPAPVVLLLSAFWLVPSYFMLRLTEQWRTHHTRGPLVESITMLFLFAPVIALGILVAQLLSSSETWPTVVGVLLSVIFGSVVSVPVRQFLLDLGNLPSVRRDEVDAANR